MKKLIISLFIPLLLVSCGKTEQTNNQLEPKKSDSYYIYNNLVSYEKLVYTFDQLNKKCPYLVNEALRLDNTRVSYGLFEYNYTLVNVDKNSTPFEELYKKLINPLEKHLLDNLKIDKYFRLYFANNITISYSINDKNGVNLLKMDITREKYNDLMKQSTETGSSQNNSGSTNDVSNYDDFYTNLTKDSDEINKMGPKMTDEESRFDNAKVSNNTIQYNYTLINVEKNNIYADKTRNDLEKKILKGLNPETYLKLYYVNNLTLSYSYSDKAGIYLFTIDITPEKYKDLIR